MFLLIGEDPFRARLRLAELVAALAAGGDPTSGSLAQWPSTSLGLTLGVTRHDARDVSPELIAMAGQAQGLFDAPDERRVVIVDHAEALKETAFIRDFPPQSALVLVTTERIQTGRRPRRGKAEADATVDLPAAVDEAGGRVERIPRLLAGEVPAWIAARAARAGVRLEPPALNELASAVGADTERVEQELAKLATYVAGGVITAAAVRALVPGAIETEVFDLTRAVVRRDPRVAVEKLERLLDEGQAPQQILALLLWQFRVLLFALRMKGMPDAERAARAIRSSANAIARWQADARRLSQADITRAYEALYATDLAIKQGRTEPETALMLCVLDLCGVPGADPRDLVIGEPPRR